MTITQALQSISLYPLTTPAVVLIAIECGLDPDAEFNTDVAGSKAFKYTKARVYAYLAEAPNVSEAGATYSFSEDERKDFRKKAMQLLEEAGETSGESSVECGYFGEDF